MFVHTLRETYQEFAQQICWRNEEGHSRLFTPYVLDNLPVHLWGRDFLCILDLKDAFFTIPLYPKDREKIAFTLSLPNHQAPGC
jgi:hypothetical protein